MNTILTIANLEMIFKENNRYYASDSDNKRTALKASEVKELIAEEALSQEDPEELIWFPTEKFESMKAPAPKKAVKKAVKKVAKKVVIKKAVAEVKVEPTVEEVEEPTVEATEDKVEDPKPTTKKVVETPKTVSTEDKKLETLIGWYGEYLELKDVEDMDADQTKRFKHIKYEIPRRQAILGNDLVKEAYLSAGYPEEAYMEPIVKGQGRTKLSKEELQAKADAHSLAVTAIANALVDAELTDNVRFEVSSLVAKLTKEGGNYAERAKLTE